MLAFCKQDVLRGRRLRGRERPYRGGVASDDNVIQFPGTAGDKSHETHARDVVDQLLRQGHTPQEILSSLMTAAPAFDLPAQREPELLTPPTEPSTYVVRVDLDGAKPPIWRRLHLASDLPLDQVHEVLQAAMGWTNSHLHQFVMGPGAPDHQIAPFLTDFDLSEGEEGIPEAEVRLGQVLGSPGDRLYYTYDFGDGWDHTMRLESVEPRGEGPAARCVAGRRACPPEDVGGIYRYHEVVELLASPRSRPTDADLGDLLEWLPPGFEPARFDAGAADQEVAVALLPEE